MTRNHKEVIQNRKVFDLISKKDNLNKIKQFRKLLKIKILNSTNMIKPMNLV